MFWVPDCKKKYIFLSYFGGVTSQLNHALKEQLVSNSKVSFFDKWVTPFRSPTTPVPLQLRLFTVINVDFKETDLTTP